MINNLLDIAKQNIKENVQISVLLTESQNIYLSKDIDGTDTLTELKINNDTTVSVMLTMWQSKEVDLPSMTFRKNLVKLNASNLNTDIVLRTNNGYLLKKLNKTLS